MLQKLFNGPARQVRPLLVAVLLALAVFWPWPAQAQWPPFRFSLDSSYDSGKITYTLTFEADVDWTMTNVMINVPLPPGTRFVEANAQPSVQVGFDGAQVSFFTEDGSEPIRTASFVVEVVDPSQTIFTTQPWVGWRGDQPGEYTVPAESVDTGKPPLVWPGYAEPGLHLEAKATASPGKIVYDVYIRHRAKARMWDIKVNVPIPAGTTFVSAEAPAPFVATQDGREVYFSATEVARNVEYGPLRFTVSTADTTAPVVTTHAWGSWKNAGRNVGKSLDQSESAQTGDLVVRPNRVETVVADPIGDVALKNYDVTSIALSQEGPAINATFYTVGDLSQTSDPIEYTLYIDSDCQASTGKSKGSVGSEFEASFRLPRTTITLKRWDTPSAAWQEVDRLAQAQPASGNAVTLPLPANVFGDSGRLCWLAEVTNWTKNYLTMPPVETTPRDAILDLVQFPFTPTAETIARPDIPDAPGVEQGVFVDVGDTWQYQPGYTEPAAGWTGLDFNDRDWLSGDSPLGYGKRYATDIKLDMVLPRATAGLGSAATSEAGTIRSLSPLPEASSLFMRRVFQVADPAQVASLTLRAAAEGGFVAYLNGSEVARANVGDPGVPVAYDTNADGSADRQIYTFDLSAAIPRLVPGSNVLAIQLHRPAGDLNVSIAPRLSWKTSKIAQVRMVAVGPTVDLAEAPAPAPNTPAAPTPIGGKLAIPLDNGQGFYDVYIYSLPAGQEIARIPYARQPNFSPDGGRLVINREGNGDENVYEYNMADGSQRQVSDAPQDWHPFYHPGGGRIVYGNAELTVGAPEWVTDEHGKMVRRGIRKPYIFVQCGVKPPHEESEPRCQDIPNLGILVPAGQMGEIQGTRPVWDANDEIVYNGCNSWSGFGKCGIYSVPSSSTKGFSDGFIPRQLTSSSEDFPTDTKGNLIAFTSNRDGNWEAYTMDLSGNGVVNVSNSPGSADGLPTLSPDHYWTAFISDRGGHWAIWVAPTAGGPAQKLFDLPRDVPWGADARRSWQNERISWGP